MIGFFLLSASTQIQKIYLNVRVIYVNCFIDDDIDNYIFHMDI